MTEKAWLKSQNTDFNKAKGLTADLRGGTQIGTAYLSKSGSSERRPLAGAVDRNWSESIVG